MRGKTSSMASTLHGDFIYGLLDHVPADTPEEGPNPD